MNYKDFSYKMDYYIYNTNPFDIKYDGKCHEIIFNRSLMDIITSKWIFDTHTQWSSCYLIPSPDVNIISKKKWFEPDIEFIVRVPKGFCPSAFFHKVFK